MGGDIRNVGTESKRLQGLDQHVKAAEGGNNLVEAKTAYEALQHELAQINNLHDPAYARALKAAVGKIDPNPDFQLTHDGKLEIQPLHMAQDTSTVADQTQTHYERRYPSDAIGDSIQMEQALLRGGNNSLYDKVARFEG